MKRQHISQKNRIKNLEAAYNTTYTDAQRLYSAAITWRTVALHHKEGEKLLTGVACLGVVFLASVMALHIYLRG